MSTPNPTTSGDIASQLATIFKDDITNQINRSMPEAAFIMARPASGKNIQWDVRFTGTAPGGGTQNEGADITTYNNDVYVPAVLQYANFFEPFALSERSIMLAALTGNPAALGDLARRWIMDAAQRLAMNLVTQFYSGAGTTNNLWGLYASGAAPIGDTGVYATIDPNTYPEWVGNVYDASAADLDVTVLRALRQKVRTAIGEDPNLYIMDPTQFDKLAGSYDDKRRFVESVESFTRADGTKITIDGGVKFLSFEGAMCIWSRNHPAQKVTALNLRHIWFEQVPDLSGSGSFGNVELSGTPDDEEGQPAFQLTARIKRLAEAGDARKFSLFMYPGLVVEGRRFHGYATNLSA